MSVNTHVHIENKSIDIYQGYEFVSEYNKGAISSFIGTVRNINDGKVVNSMTYDVQVEMSITTINDICNENILNIDSDLKQYVTHFDGHLHVGGISVAIFVSSMHRKAAIAASQYLIENIKIRAPIWKKEHYIEGHSEWLKGCALSCK